MVKIYALTDPRSGERRYVGQSRQRYLCNRLAQHCHERGNDRKDRWVDELKANKLRPGIVLLEIVADDRACESENRWIAKLRQTGSDLFNLYDADLSAPRPVASREKLASTRRTITGWTHSPTTKAKIGRRGGANSQAKIDEAKVRAIREAVSSGKSCRSVARESGLSYQHVSDLVLRKVWAHVA